MHHPSRLVKVKPPSKVRLGSIGIPEPCYIPRSLKGWLLACIFCFIWGRLFFGGITAMVLVCKDSSLCFLKVEGEI